LNSLRIADCGLRISFQPFQIFTSIPKAHVFDVGIRDPQSAIRNQVLRSSSSDISGGH
jgi:hypothetical protein